MKYTPKLYAKAFAEVASTKKEVRTELIKNFLEVIGKNGDWHEIGKIFKETEKIIRVKAGRKKIVLETARALKKSPEKILGNFFQARDIVEEKINPELIAGLKIIVNEENQFDGSLRRKINKIFS